MSWKLLDLYCGAGGCSMGYSRAGFTVTGVDIVQQKRYPFNFIQADALEYLKNHHSEFDAIHASPPCQKFSIASKVFRDKGKRYIDYLTPTREALMKLRKLYVIENVPGSPMNTCLILCGLMFGLKVFRHRKFESSILLFSQAHPSHNGKRIGNGYYSVAGGAGRWKSWGKVVRDVSKGTAKQWSEAMGISWMTRKELTQAIPPAYTEYIGKQLIEVLNKEAVEHPATQKV